MFEEDWLMMSVKVIILSLIYGIGTNDILKMIGFK